MTGACGRTVAVSDHAVSVDTSLKVSHNRWHPRNAQGAYVAGDVLIDNIRFE